MIYFQFKNIFIYETYYHNKNLDKSSHMIMITKKVPFRNCHFHNKNKLNHITCYSFAYLRLFKSVLSKYVINKVVLEQDVLHIHYFNITIYNWFLVEHIERFCRLFYFFLYTIHSVLAKIWYSKCTCHFVSLKAKRIPWNIF